jgi:uncharacterized pyridoxal phosphate-containing UPF0001 family protein
MLPTTQPTAPTELLEISPEGLEIANCYLQCQDAKVVADELDVPVELVTKTLQRREIRSYIDQVFFDVGYNNRFKMRKAMDALIKQKFQDMDEAQIGSSKDIAELLALSHKMSMEYLDKQIQLEKIRGDSSNIKSQVNVQINSGLGDGTKYGALISKLLQPGDTDAPNF